MRPPDVKNNAETKPYDVVMMFKIMPNKKRHKDIDARWTQKGGVNFVGYKLNGKVDRKSKFLKECVVTSASVHDSQAVEFLLDESDNGQDLHADSAYVGQEDTLKLYNVTGKICEKGYRNHPLTERQKELNRQKSSIRSRIVRL